MSNSNPTILIVDDEPDILQFLEYNLKKEGFNVYKANNGVEAIDIARKVIPDLIVMDIMMPELDGIEACIKIRTYHELTETLVVFLTARSEDFSEIAGFRAGADDYVSKPIRLNVFLSRIKAVLNRKNSNKTKDSILQFHNIMVNLELREVRKDGKLIELTKKEYDVLMLLLSKPDNIFTRDEIYSKVWGADLIVGDRTLDVYISKLRDKLGDGLIKTKIGVGYSFSNV